MMSNIVTWLSRLQIVKSVLKRFVLQYSSIVVFFLVSQSEKDQVSKKVQSQEDV